MDLTGEYLPTSSREEDDGPEYESGGKFVQTVEKRERGEHQFVHRFPVDVTIPKNRIANLGDINVYVESFDYLVPENACLKLNADLTITGIYGEQQTISPQEVEYNQEEIYESLHRAVPAAESVEEEIETEEDLEERPEVYEYEDYEEEEEESSIEDEGRDEYESFSVEGRTPPSEQEDEIPVHIQYDSHSNESNKELQLRNENVFELPEHELSESSEEQQELQQEMPKTFKKPANKMVKSQEEELEEESSSSMEVEMEEETSDDQNAKKKKVKGKKKYESISLTDFFARKEEERAAKLRVCIVQEGETLDYIAEKYELTIPQLLRVNQLEANQDVFVGQVLYIPNSGEPAFKS